MNETSFASRSANWLVLPPTNNLVTNFIPFLASSLNFSWWNWTSKLFFFFCEFFHPYVCMITCAQNYLFEKISSSQLLKYSPFECLYVIRRYCQNSLLWLTAFWGHWLHFKAPLEPLLLLLFWNKTVANAQTERARMPSLPCTLVGKNSRTPRWQRGFHFCLDEDFPLPVRWLWYFNWSYKFNFEVL